MNEEEVWKAMALFEENKPEQASDPIMYRKMGGWAVLEQLNQAKNPLTSKELSDAIGVSSARMTVLLQKMEGEGLVGKVPSPKDGRVILVSSTDKGRQKARDIQGRRYACMEKILTEFTLQDLEQHFAQKNRFRQIFEASMGLETKREQGKTQEKEDRTCAKIDS